MTDIFSLEFLKQKTTTKILIRRNQMYYIQLIYSFFYVRTFRNVY